MAFSKLWHASIICLRLFWHFERPAASRTFWTAGRSRPIRIAMIAMMTSSSMSVKPRRPRRDVDMARAPWVKPAQTCRLRPIGRRATIREDDSFVTFAARLQERNGRCKGKDVYGSRNLGGSGGVSGPAVAGRTAWERGLVRRLVVARDLAAVAGAEGAPGRRLDRVADETHRAVHEEHVDTARVVAARGHHGV